MFRKGRKAGLVVKTGAFAIIFALAALGQGQAASVAGPDCQPKFQGCKEDSCEELEKADVCGDLGDECIRVLECIKCQDAPEKIGVLCEVEEPD